MKQQVNHDLSFSIFVVSREDAAALKAVSTLGQSLSGLRSFAVVIPEDNHAHPIDPIAQIHGGTDGEKVDGLFAWMTTNQPELRSVRVVALQSQKLLAENQTALLEIATWLGERSSTYAPNVGVRQIRLGLFCEGKVSDSLSLFVDGSAINLAVIPRDSQTHAGMAQPITDLKQELLISHFQIELATLFGLWREMRTCIVDEFPLVAGGDGRVWLRFVSSRALILECPPLPIASVVDGDGDLATPVDCEPFPGSQERIDSFVRCIYPNELRFEPTSPPDGIVKTDARSFWRQYISEFGKALVRLPKLLVRDAQGELNDLSASILQEAVGGSNSHIRVLLASDVGETHAAAVTAEQVDEMISRLTTETDSSRRLVLEPRHWNQLVEKSLSFVDGSSVASADRERVGQENWLVVEKGVLGPKADEVAEILSTFGSCLETELDEWNAELPEVADPQSGSEVSPSGDHLNAEAQELGASDGSSGILPAEGERNFAVPAESLLAPPSEFVLSTDQNAKSVSVAADVTAKPDTPVNLEQSTVLTAVAVEFIREADKAGRNVRAMVDRLRRIPGEFAPREAAVISKTIKAALFLGFGVAYFVTGTLTDRRYWLSGEPLTPYTRDFIWSFVATLIVCISIAGLLVKTSGRWQARVITAITVCTVVVALEWVFFAPIRDFILRIRPLRTTALVGALLMAGTIAIALTSYARNRLSKSLLRKKFASTLLGLLCVFCLVGITAYFGNDRSPIRGLSDQVQLRLMIVGYVLSVSLVFGGAAVYAFVVLREKYRLNLLAETLRWAETELLESALAERTLRRAAIQWVGSAVVLARLIRYPLGRKIHDSVRHAEMVTRVDPNLMKFGKAALRLTDRGRHGLASRLRLLFIRRGWLSSQYHHLTRAFQRDWAFSKGLDEDNMSPVEPEMCPVVPTWPEVISDSARGTRWQFMRSVFDGKYDESLLVRSSEVRLEDAYSTILSDRAAHLIGDTGDLDASSYFHRLVPSGVRLLDGGLVTTVFSGNDPKQQMETHVWWPRDLVSLKEQETPDVRVAAVRESDVLTPDRISSTIRLFGSCVSVSELFTTDEISSKSSVG
jgi:hypothetical protein